MSYSLPSINDLPFSTKEQKRPNVALPYTVTEEQAYKVIDHSGATQVAETELYKALHHFNGLTLAEQDALEEMAFHDYWVVYLSNGIVTIEPMYEAHHGSAHSSLYKCLDRSATVILQEHTSL
jgi:hypothetical protein